MQFHSRHEKRDRNLPEVSRGLLDNIITGLPKKDGIEGVFLGGSMAEGNEDFYSDIDLRVVVAADRFSEYVRQKRRLAEEFGDVLFFEDMNQSAPYTVAHYHNFIKVDLFVYTWAQIRPSLWLRGVKALYDPSGKLEGILRCSDELTYYVIRDEFEKWRGKVFAYIHEVYRRAMREEYYYALTMIDHLRLFIVAGWNMEAGRRGNDFLDWARVEGKRSQLAPWQQKMLSGWTCHRDQREIMNTLEGMIPENRRLYAVLSAKIGIDADLEGFDRIVNMVL